MDALSHTFETDSADALAIQEGLHDLRQGLQWELERLDAFMEILHQGQHGKTVGAETSDEMPSANTRKFRSLRRVPHRGLPHSPTEPPPPPDDGMKPDPPPCLQITGSHVPHSPRASSRPSTPTPEEPHSLAFTPPGAGQAYPYKFMAQGLESVAEFPSPPHRPRTPPEPPIVAETRSGSLPNTDSQGSLPRRGHNTRNLSKIGRSVSLTALKGDSAFYRNHGTACSGDLTHYKRTWEMEKRKQELLKSKSLIEREPKKPSQIIKDTAYHQYFEAFFAIAILASALVYGAEVQYQAHHPKEWEPMGFFVMHQVFTVVFLVELVIRVYSVGLWHFLFGKEHCAWGWLDVFVCTASLLESVLGTVLLATTEGGQIVDTGPVRIARMVRVLRVSRAFRLQRFMWYVGSLRTLVYSIAATLRSLFWAMVLLLAIMYVFAMSFTQFTVDFSLNLDADPLVVHEMSLYFGTLDRSMLTLFQSIAGGLSWRAATLPMAEVSPLLVVLFIAYIAFVLFAVLNVVTGVFCSSAIETTSHTPDLVARSLIDNQHVYEEELRKLFHTIDAGDTGLITLSEFESLQGDEVALAYFRALEIDFQDAWSIFKLIDKDKGGAIEIDEFVRGCQQLRGDASSVEMKELAFDLRRLSEYMHRAVAKMEERCEQLATEVHTVVPSAPKAAKRVGSTVPA